MAMPYAGAELDLIPAAERAASDSLREKAHGERAVEALLECLALCRHDRQRRSLENRVVLLSLEIADTAAHRYSGRGVELDDLIQVARLALVKAVRGYRPERGNGFAAYAVPTVTGEIKRHFRDYAWAMRPPRSLQELSGRMGRDEAALRQRLRRDPTEEELAASLGVSTEVLRQARSASLNFHTDSLDYTAEDSAPIQVPDVRDDIDKMLTRQVLRAALAQLTALERDILQMRFVEELSQSRIAAEIGVSQMQVSRLLSRILTRLRSSLTETSAQPVA
jgi:RNA polymerase sigma-B factor